MRVRVEDRPGALAEVAAVIADTESNVTRLEVVSREGDYVWDDFEIEAESEQAIGSVVRALRSAGFEVIGLPPNWQIRDWALTVVEAMAAIVDLEDGVDSEPVFLDGLSELARTDHSLLLTDDVDGLGGDPAGRWERLVSIASTVDNDAVAWSGDHEAQLAVRAALTSAGQPQVTRSPRNRIGGAAFLLGSTPRRGVVAAVGGRPPFLRAEIERLRRYIQVVGGSLLLRGPVPL